VSTAPVGIKKKQFVLRNASSPRLGGANGYKIIEIREVQFLKAFFPIFITLLGIVIEVRDLHPLNAPYPILVTLSGILIEDSSVHS
jgi:hypothetical protein